MELLETVEVTTGTAPVGTVIWLHGLGADGHDFEPIVPELNLSASLRFVFPHAPVRPVTVNGGMPMRAWFDILSLDTEGRADRAGIEASTVAVDALIAREIERGIPDHRIVIAGFSQGGAIALHTLLTTPHKLAGIMALSTFLAVQDALSTASSRREIPIFMAHGQFDPVLPLEWGQTSADKLREAGYVLEWSDYPMAHAVCPQEIAAISQWLGGVFGD